MTFQQLLEDRKLSVSALARMADVGRPGLSDSIAGKRARPWQWWLAVAGALDLDHAELNELLEPVMGGSSGGGSFGQRRYARTSRRREVVGERWRPGSNPR